MSCCLAGVRRIRRGDARGHMRMMQTAGFLVGLFLASYVLKLVLLGPEDRSAWGQASLWTLYAHEGSVAVMLASAGFAATRARRFAAVLGEPLHSRGERSRDRVLHRRAGWTAVASSALALALAARVLAGMYARGGL